MIMKIIEQINFDERKLVPAIVQDDDSGQVLMMAYMNPESLELSLETGYTHFWSRSRKKLWKKGETSGHFQKIKAIYYDCDADTLLVSVDQTGPACHTGNKSCFFRIISNSVEGKETAFIHRGSWLILRDLEEVIIDRKKNPREGSYVGKLFREGKKLIRDKILEESREVVEASAEDDSDQIVYEAADLIFHLMVLLSAHGLGIEQVKKELMRRFGNPPKKKKVAKEENE